MIFHSLIILGIICLLTSTDAQISPCSEKLPFMNYRREVLVQELPSTKTQYKHKAPPQNPDNVIPIDHRLRRRKRSRTRRHHHHHIRTVHGLVNIIGWGILSPIGVIAARYFKKLPFQSKNWYNLHILSQISGFILGTIGWGLGMSIRAAAKEHAMSLHGILGTIIFTLNAIQVLTMWLASNEEHEFRNRNWRICHYAMGYVLIVLIVANIFQGIGRQTLANIWNLLYGLIVGALALIALALELLRWIKFDFH